MLDNGDDPSTVTDESFGTALDRVQAAVDSGQIRRFTGNDYAQPLAKGDRRGRCRWSGDIFQLRPSNPKLKWALAGRRAAMIWTDNMLIPTRWRASATASTFMNFVYDPKIAAQIAAYVNYVPPVKGTQGGAREDRSRAGEEPAHLPGRRDARADVTQFDSAALNNQTYIEQWQQVLGA